MKTEDILTIIAGGVLAFVAWKTLFAGKTAATKSTPTVNSWTGEITNNALPGQAGWGWSYYDGGIAIAPNGDYYQNGNLIWKAP